MQSSVTDFYEEEWYSICCDAPPLYELCIDTSVPLQIGLCMNCRDHSVFELDNESEWVYKLDYENRYRYGCKS
jgi:hypothetical protein